MKKNLPASLKRLVRSIEKQKGLNPSTFKTLLTKAKVKEKDLMPWATFNHPKEDSYGRKLAYDGGYFEVMVMSWVPGDFSAIHDHGATIWGAVQIFGEAEHSIFYVNEGKITTAIRHEVTPGQILSVGHDLIHQMGNTGKKRFLSLHVYGNDELEGDITGNARIFDLHRKQIHYTSWGVFFELPKAFLNKSVSGPKPDFASWLRDTSEYVKRLDLIGVKGRKNKKAAVNDLMDAKHFRELVKNIQEYTGEDGKVSNSQYWNDLNKELMVASEVQKNVLKMERSDDSFATYAELYDEVIGKPCLEDFMASYIRFVKKQYQINFKKSNLLSIGCGTGLIEDFMIRKMGFEKKNLFGIDISKAMIKVASQKINAEFGNLLELDPRVKMWDLAYCGLNVFQYLDHRILEDVIRQTSRILYPGGIFFGDFITPDHIRWYPNVIFSKNKKVVSLRTPTLVEKDFCIYQRSKIFNVSTLKGDLRITYEGEHERFLPSMQRVYTEFKKVFDQVDLYDAVTLKPIPIYADTCTSTRYLVVAKKD